MRSSAALLLCCLFLLAMPGPGGADTTPRPGFGVAFLNNARPVSPSPTGHSTADWEWRPLYVNDNTHFAMPVYPTTVGKLGYWFTASAWKTHLTTACPWSGTGLYLHNGSPSSIWRRYQSTLYYQINNAAIPNPNAVPGYEVSDYYYNRYASTGTIPSNALPSNWYLDPFRRMVVESMMTSYDGFGSWGLYGDMATLFEDCPGTAGANMGAGGVGLYLLFLACEYALCFSYDEMVQNLEQQAALYRSYFAPADHNFFSLYDPAQGRVTIVRRKIPNYSVPSGAEASIAPTRDCIGTFALCTDQAVSSGSGQTSKTKTATISETFTTASVPFQLALEAEDTSAGSGSKLSGRFQVRVHAPAGGGQPEQWFACQVAGTPSGQWLTPWSFVTQKNNQAAWNSTTNGTDYAGTNGTNVSTTFATGGQNILSVNWSGELIIRAMDFGVDRLDKLELMVATEAMGGMKSTGRVCVQPIFSRNIAEAGPWRTATIGSAVSFSAEASALPSNAQSTTYTWDFGDGQTATGQNVSHAFAQPGIYDVLLKTDPQVPTQAPNKDLFNDTTKGFSYDICRVSVGTSSGETLSSTDPSVTFSNIVFTASPTAIVATWNTNVVTNDLVTYRIPGQTGWQVCMSGYRTSHQLDASNLTPGTTYAVGVGGHKFEETTYIYAKHGDSTTWTVATPATGQPNNVVATQSGLTFANLRFDATPGKIIASWNTDKTASAKVQYTTSPTATPTQQVTSTANSTSHQLTLTGLTNGTTYYLTVSSTPQGSTTPVVCRYNGTSAWEVKVPGVYSGGGRTTDVTCVEYACAIPQAANQYKYQARLSQIAQVRLVRRLLPSGSWAQTAWISNTRDPNWTLGTVDGKAYEFAIEEHQDNGDAVRSRTWIHVAESAPPPPPPPPPPAQGRLVTTFSVNAADGANVTFPQALESQPVILVSATRNGQALAACAVNNSRTGFRLSLRDANNQAVTQPTTVCCLAFAPGAGDKLRGDCAQYGDNAQVNITPAFSGPPVIICNAQVSGKAVLACAMDNAAGGFKLCLRDLNGVPVSRAWVQWLAVQCPLKLKLTTGRLSASGKVLKASDGYRCSYPQMPAEPVVLGSAQLGNAYLVGPTSRTATQAVLSIRSHDNQPGGSVWLQWLAISAD